MCLQYVAYSLQQWPNDLIEIAQLKTDPCLHVAHLAVLYCDKPYCTEYVLAALYCTERWYCTKLNSDELNIQYSTVLYSKYCTVRSPLVHYGVLYFSSTVQYSICSTVLYSTYVQYIKYAVYVLYTYA